MYRLKRLSFDLSDSRSTGQHRKPTVTAKFLKAGICGYISLHHTRTGSALGALEDFDSADQVRGSSDVVERQVAVVFLGQ